MTTTARKATWLSSLGAGLEYYDFIVYGMMVSYLNTLFFATGETWIDTIKAFVVFAIGYLIRPFGGVLFGMWGDTFGRKNTFISVMLLMAISTFAIGLLPTYAQIGVYASILLIILRISQGVSFGAELPGAITVVNEYAAAEKKSLYSGFVISSVSAGSILASLILFIMSKSLEKESILSWGWRVPFLIGGCLALVNYFIRKHLQETPAFTDLQTKRSPVRIKEPFIKLFQQHLRAVILGLGLTTLASSLVIFNLYLPTYLSVHFGYLLSDIYLSMTYGLIWSALTLPICGYLADKWGRKQVFLGTCIAFILIAFPLFRTLLYGNFFSLVFFMLTLQTIISLLMSTYFPILAGVFETDVRYTGLAFCYNVVYALMGSAPILITYLIEKTNTPWVGVWFLIGCAAISLVSMGAKKT